MCIVWCETTCHREQCIRVLELGLVARVGQSAIDTQIEALDSSLQKSTRPLDPNQLELSKLGRVGLTESFG